MKSGWRSSDATTYSLLEKFDTLRQLESRIRGAEAPQEGGSMLTIEQMRGVRDVTGLSIRYQDSFDGRWSDAVGRLHGARAGLGKIRIVAESEGQGRASGK